LQKERGEEPKLPGLNYSINQLFWISAAQTWCSVSFAQKEDQQRNNNLIINAI